MKPFNCVKTNDYLNVELFIFDRTKPFNKQLRPGFEFVSAIIFLTTITVTQRTPLNYLYPDKILFNLPTYWQMKTSILALVIGTFKWLQKHAMFDMRSLWYWFEYSFIKKLFLLIWYPLNVGIAYFTNLFCWRRLETERALVGELLIFLWEDWRLNTNTNSQYICVFYKRSVLSLTCRWKWNRRSEFKSWVRLFAFQFV